MVTYTVDEDGERDRHPGHARVAAQAVVRGPNRSGDAGQLDDLVGREAEALEPAQVSLDEPVEAASNRRRSDD